MFISSDSRRKRTKEDCYPNPYTGALIDYDGDPLRQGFGINHKAFALTGDLFFFMKVELINDNLLSELHQKAKENERLRMNYDLRTTPEDTSQRMLNALEPGTHVAIHRHLKTSETVICLEGCLEWIFYEELPGVDTGGPVHDGETAVDETAFAEVARFRVCPREKLYGIQVPKGAWHSIVVHEPSTIFEAKDGAYGK